MFQAPAIWMHIVHCTVMIAVPHVYSQLEVIRESFIQINIRLICYTMIFVYLAPLPTTLIDNYASSCCWDLESHINPSRTVQSIWCPPFSWYLVYRLPTLDLLRIGGDSHQDQVLFLIFHTFSFTREICYRLLVSWWILSLRIKRR